MEKTKTMKHTLILIILSLSFVSTFAQDEWIVPEDKAAKKAKSFFSEENAKKGEILFKNNCTACHGTPTMGNFVALVPSPGDPASDKFQKNSDGELLYKIREGRSTMPAFKNTLSTEDIWNIIAYLRTFNDSYVQEIIETVDSAGLTTKTLNLILSYISETSQIQAELIPGDSLAPQLSDIEVALYVKRYFGEMKIDKHKRTNNRGMAIFDIPDDIPGDTAGLVTFLAKLTDDEAYGTVETSGLFSVGIPTNKPSLVAERAMWNTMRKAPIWLLLTYFIVVGTVWGFIIYVMLLLKKIYVSGKEDNNIKILKE